MDIEFHYHIIYLIAARAGFNTTDAYLIAYSSQFVDDNTIIYEINPGKSEYYKNYISQTYNILKPRRKLFRIYPLFHFVPGDLLNGDPRKDGKLHQLNTTPDSVNSRKILRAALRSKDLYRTGIACHAYADTWSHQNFTGYYDDFNAMKKPLERPSPLFKYTGKGIFVGHASAYHNPDRINEIWEDRRLATRFSTRKNNRIFLQAVGRIFEELYKFNHPGFKNKDFIAEQDDLIKDIAHAMKGKNKEQRIDNYKELSLKEKYGNLEIRDYDSCAWIEEAISGKLRRLSAPGRHAIIKFLWTYFSNNLFSCVNIYSWSQPEKYKDTHWYKFQEAVKQHQKEASGILNRTKVGNLELADW